MFASVAEFLGVNDFARMTARQVGNHIVWSSNKMCFDLCNPIRFSTLVP